VVANDGLLSGRAQDANASPWPDLDLLLSWTGRLPVILRALWRPRALLAAGANSGAGPTGFEPVFPDRRVLLPAFANLRRIAPRWQGGDGNPASDVTPACTRLCEILEADLLYAVGAARVLQLRPACSEPRRRPHTEAWTTECAIPLNQKSARQSLGNAGDPTKCFSGIGRRIDRAATISHVRKDRVKLRKSRQGPARLAC
jgi:hypothetical protein